MNSLSKKVLAGDRRSIGRAISLAEDAGRGVTDLLREIFPHTGRALVIGITGSPGAGKSTLVDRLAAYYRASDERVGIVAVDPSSPFTGGALLGDRIRMQKMATDPGIFIRSMASRGHLGGVARATADAVAILDAAGYNKVIIETVGVGQDEVDVVKTADVTVVVLVPGMGDGVQAMKAGIMEIGDVFAINKADRDGVLRTERELEMLLSISDRRPDGWTPLIVKTVATEGSGTEALAGAIGGYQGFIASHREQSEAKRALIAEHRITELLRERLLQTATATLSKDEFREMAGSVADRRRDPYSVVDEIILRLGIDH